MAFLACFLSFITIQEKTPDNCGENKNKKDKFCLCVLLCLLREPGLEAGVCSVPGGGPESLGRALGGRLPRRARAPLLPTVLGSTVLSALRSGHASALHARRICHAVSRRG